MRHFSVIVLALSLVAAPLAVATPGPDCAKKCTADASAKKCNPADCTKSEKCTPEEKAKCAAKKEGKSEAPKAPKN